MHIQDIEDLNINLPREIVGLTLSLSDAKIERL